MKNYTPTNPDEESPELAAQRRSLDKMSAALTRNLNRMIAEQEARVREFAAQHPTTPGPETLNVPALPPRGESLPRTYTAPQPPAPQQPALKPQHPVQTELRQPKAVPPPLPKKEQPVRAAASRVLPKQGPWKKTPEKKEGEISTGCVVVFLIVLFIMLRACT